MEKTGKSKDLLLRLLNDSENSVLKRKSNSERIEMTYKPSTIPRLKFYGYSNRNDIDNCLIIDEYWNYEDDINPHKEQDGLFNYIVEYHKQRLNSIKQYKEYYYG